MNLSHFGKKKYVILFLKEYQKETGRRKQETDMGEVEKCYKKKIRYVYRRLRLEAGIRACLNGLLISLAGAAVVLGYGRFWIGELMTTDAMWLAAGLFPAATVLIYWILLRPGKKEVLEELDAAGLQERMITMEELSGREDLLARKQRQDAKERLAEAELTGRGIRIPIAPFLWSLILAVGIGWLVYLPFPEPEAEDMSGQNVEDGLVDELVAMLRTLIDVSELNEENKGNLHEVLDSLAAAFVPEDTTLSRTAKITAASKHLDVLEAESESRLESLRKGEKTEEMQKQLALAETEQKLLEETIDAMQEIMGTSLEKIRKLGGTFWTPQGPKSSNTGEEPQEGEEPSENMEQPEGEPMDGEELWGEMDGEQMGGGTEQIYDPEQGEVSYGVVYDTYYTELMKALTETELPQELRKLIEEYANTLE